MLSVVYNTTPYQCRLLYIIVLYITYYSCPCYIQCILLLNYYRITIILLLFSSRTSEGVYTTLF